MSDFWKGYEPEPTRAAQSEPPCKTGSQCTSKCQQCVVQEPVARYCCHSCFKASSCMMLDRMILCSGCGNKRCPKASDHRLDCTSSNDPGQPGSVYTTPPAQPAVPDAFGTREGEHPEYIQGWNDCRAEMLRGMKL
jgi:hypothetical protein